MTGTKDSAKCRLKGMDLLSFWKPGLVAVAGIAVGLALTVSGVRAGARPAGIEPLPAVAGVQVTKPSEPTLSFADGVLGVAMEINGEEAIVETPLVVLGAPSRFTVTVYNQGLGQLSDVTVIDLESGTRLVCDSSSILSGSATVCVMDGSTALLSAGVFTNRFSVSARAEDGTTREGAFEARFLLAAPGTPEAVIGAAAGLDPVVTDVPDAPDVTDVPDVPDAASQGTGSDPAGSEPEAPVPDSSE